jgi:hypothetical protein
MRHRAQGCDLLAVWRCDGVRNNEHSAQVQELSEAIARGWLSARDVAGKLVLVKRPPEASQESRKFSREGRIIASRVGEVHQLLANQVIECTLRAEASFDGFCCLALLDPNLLESHVRGI